MFSRSALRSSTALIALAVAGSALADGPYRGSIKDSPYVAPFSWTGMYVGVNAGYAWSKSSGSTVVTCPGPVCFTPESTAFLSAANTGSLDTDGFTGGVQAGYNLQSGNVVYGVELDFNALDIAQRRTVSGITPGGTNFTSSTGISSDWLFTARARLGLTLAPNLLAYITGGLAVADIDVSNTLGTNDFAPPYAGGSNHGTTKTGWTLGGGLEYAVSRNWTVKGEYLFVDLGSVSTSAVVNQTPIGGLSSTFMSTSADLNLHIARVGINYKF